MCSCMRYFTQKKLSESFKKTYPKGRKMQSRIIIQATQKDANKAFNKLRYLSVRYIESRGEDEWEIDIRHPEECRNRLLNIETAAALFALDKKLGA